MAWVEQRIWADDDPLRSGWLNTMLRDDLSYLYDPPRVWVSRDAAQQIRAYTTEFIDFTRAVSDPWGMQGCAAAEEAGYSRTVGVTFRRTGRYLTVAVASVMPTSTGVLAALVTGQNVIYSGGGYASIPVTTSQWETFIRAETIITADSADGDDWILYALVASCAPTGTQLDVPHGYPSRPMLSCHWIGGV